MSDRPTAGDISRGSITAQSSNVEPTRPGSQSAAHAESQNSSALRPFEVPSLPLTSSTRRDAPPAAPSRSASFTNILNPATHADEQVHGRRRKASELSSPSDSRPQLPPLSAEVPYSQTQSPSLSATVAQSFSPRLAHGRRILTPKSPALHRAASLGQLGTPTGTLDAQLLPFPLSPRSRMYTIEPGRAGVPPLPVPVPSAPPSYSRSPQVARTRPAQSSRVKERRGRSSSLSPRSGYGAENSPAQTMPRTDHPSTQGSAAATHSRRSYINEDESELYSSQIISDHRTGGIPITPSAGQSAFQMMTLQTSAGTVQLPVEVQAASRVADEKRRRNAGASARFRARRKEKEKESSVTIAKLEAQVKELSEDVEFYRRERGYLAGIVLQVPGGERHFPRPSSPRHHRVPYELQIGPSRSTSVGYMSDPDAPQSPGELRNVRRRTSTMSLPVQDHSSGAPMGNIANSSAYPSTRYDMLPMAGPPAQTRPSLPGPAALLAPASQQQIQYSQSSHGEPSWTAYGSGQQSSAGDNPNAHRPYQP